MRFTRGVKAKHPVYSSQFFCAYSMRIKWNTNSVAGAAPCVQHASTLTGAAPGEFKWLLRRRNNPRPSLLLQGFFAPEVYGHQNLHSNPAAAMAKIVDAHYFSERLPVKRAMLIRIGISDKHAHTFRIELILRCKIDALSRRVERRQDFVEVMSPSIGRPHTNSLSKPQPRSPAAFRTRQSCHS